MSFVDACALDQLGNLPYAVEIDGLALAIVKVDDEVFAITDRCSHGAVPLSEGDVEGCTIECYLHGSVFDLRTGEPKNLPATQPVPVYPTKVSDGRVLVDLANPINTSTDAATADVDSKEN